MNSPDAVLIMLADESAKIIECNNAAIKMLKAKDRSEVIGVTPDKLSPKFQPDGRSSFESAAEKIEIVVRDGSHRFEWIHQRFDGENFPCDVNISLVQYRGRLSFIVNWRDISEAKKLEKTIILERENFKNSV